MFHFPGLSYKDLFDKKFELEEYVAKQDIRKSCKIKLADIGLAIKFNKGDMQETYCGTPLYMAPEVARGDPYDNTADVWSIGCIFFQLLVGFLPFTANNAFQLVKALEDGKYYVPKFIKLSATSKTILSCLLQHDPLKRINLRVLLEDKTITEEESKMAMPAKASIKEQRDFLQETEDPYEWMSDHPKRCEEFSTFEFIETDVNKKKNKQPQD